MSLGHKKWIVAFLKEKGNECSYDELVQEGEKHECDTLAAMLKLLKSKEKCIDFAGQFLMYPMHKDVKVTLTKPDFEPA